MAFFAEDIHRLASASVDGRIYVWRIDEGPDEENKPQISGKIDIAIQIVGDTEAYHPRICWHSHKQEHLFVGIGNCVLRIDTTKVGRGRDFSAEEPIKCHLDKLIDGVRLVGKHDGDVTDLSISQWMTTRLASGSKDGTVKIWDDRKPAPLSILKPHDGRAVYSVAFLKAPDRPDHINLITAGPLNQEIKIWASTSGEGWSNDSETWNCTQTLELVSSLEPRVEEAFFNQVSVLPQASIILLANAKKHAIYAVHVEYGLDPASTRLDYIADFTVAMPILSLTGTHESQPDGEQVVQVYCVQTMAIQQYGLELSLCSPPITDTTGLGRDPAISRVYETPLEGVGTESSMGTSFTDFYSVGISSKPSTVEQSAEFDPKPSAPPLTYTGGDGTHLPSAPLASNMGLAGSGPSLGNRDSDQSAFDYATNGSMEPDALSRLDTPVRKDSLGKDEPRDSHSDVTMLPNPHVMFKVGGNTTHLITPSEIISGALSSVESNHVSKFGEVKIQDGSSSSPRIAEVEPKHIDESKSDQVFELEAVKEAQVVCDNTEKAQNSLEQTVEMISERSVTTDKYSVEESRSQSDRVVPEHTGAADENVLKKTVEMSEKSDYSPSSREQSSSYIKEKDKVLRHQASGQSSPSTSAFNSTESSHEPLSSAYPPVDSSPEVAAMQGMLQQLIAMQDMQKQLGTMVNVSIAKEGKRIETSLGRAMEKSIKAGIDALWARFQEENAKREKAGRERMQQMTTLITSSISKDLAAMLEKSLKKEISSLGPVVARAITPIIEKSLASAVADSVQKLVGDKVVNQLDKSISAKLEATLARQIQVQFHTSVKQALQDALRTSVESLLVPAFEQCCKTMFEQVDSAFQKGMSEHTVSIQQQVEAAHTPLVLTLKETITSASSITQSLTSELLVGHHKLLALVAASGNTKAHNTNVLQPSNGPITGPPEVEAPLDPMKELSRLISERKFDEAFTMALQRSDVSMVSWLCSQVDLHALFAMAPVPLNQGVLLALLQQLAVDIGTETSRKVQWMTDVAMAINPTDPRIAMHVRPIFEQVYNTLDHQRSLPSTSPSDGTSIRLIMHVINSVLLSYK